MSCTTLPAYSSMFTDDITARSAHTFRAHLQDDRQHTVALRHVRDQGPEFAGNCVNIRLDGATGRLTPLGGAVVMVMIHRAGDRIRVCSTLHSTPLCPPGPTTARQRPCESAAAPALSSGPSSQQRPQLSAASPALSSSPTQQHRRHEGRRHSSAGADFRLDGRHRVASPAQNNSQ